MIFDTHCHGYWNGLAHKQAEVLRNMRAEGVMRSVQIGTGLDRSRQALILSREWGSDTWCAAGIHPSGCQDLPAKSAPELMAQLEALIKANRDKIVAVGETGSLFPRDPRKGAQQKQAQRVFFAAQASWLSSTCRW
jgi:TatD DNase family protein